MLLIPNRALPSQTAATLKTYEDAILAEADYPRRVALAKADFGRHSSNATFQVIRSILSDMCAGARRCMYCEDSAADEIEHHRPKDLYPEQVFSWLNYLYACGPCNSPKQNKFAVLDPQNQRVDIARRRSDPVVPPMAGPTILLDPRVDNPLQFLWLDIAGDTFLFVPIPGLAPTATIRAEYTIELLKLNDRDYLPRARREAFGSYRARLKEYIHHKNDGATQPQLNLFIHAIQRMGHPTVWLEMQRQQSLIPALHTLFNQAPEALHW